MNLLVNFFESCNEGILSKETEGRDSMVKWGETPLEGWRGRGFFDKNCSTFSLFTFHLENSILSAHVKPSLENNSRNLLISIGIVIKVTVYIYPIKFNFIKALFSVCILV